MANTMYLKLTGASTGEIKGDCTQSGREDMILVYQSDHTVEIPTDTHTGLATGQRIHKPLKITKHKDQATPLLYQACCTGEQITEFELWFYRINDKGQEEQYFTIKLEKAVVVQMKEYTPMTFLPENKPYHDMEEVWFSYEKIVWTFNPDGIEAEDDWKSPATS
ncbi:MAG: Hcp family type VI secretion system effector [Candidatus Electrothrix aestuarii]|uniref:Hcp family type VI secretion system effector n=1 Tax=Candidatus Electrothrix aestuarii TaxID=3062594 RepID=A0AAU8LUZ0_9BACT|nr:Hcp family type VI secretion system effector [Candidatus Electrothrix aestuarii]